MPSDLVKELRAKANMTESGLNTRVYCLHYRDALRRAADEIERLESDVDKFKRIANSLSSDGGREG